MPLPNLPRYTVWWTAITILVFKITFCHPCLFGIEWNSHFVMQFSHFFRIDAPPTSTAGVWFCSLPTRCQISSSTISSSQRRTILCYFVHPVNRPNTAQARRRRKQLDSNPTEPGLVADCSPISNLIKFNQQPYLVQSVSSFRIALALFLRTNTPSSSYESMGHVSPE